MSRSSYQAWLTNGPRAGAPLMLHYRLYFMNASSGHIEHCEQLQALEHGEAVRLAAEHLSDRSLELWHRDRLVRRFDVPND